MPLGMGNKQRNDELLYHKVISELSKQLTVFTQNKQTTLVMQTLKHEPVMIMAKVIA